MEVNRKDLLDYLTNINSDNTIKEIKIHGEFISDIKKEINAYFTKKYKDGSSESLVYVISFDNYIKFIVKRRKEKLLRLKECINSKKVIL